MSEKFRARVRARALRDVYGLGETVGSVAADIASIIGDAVAEAVNAATGLWRFGGVKVSVEERVEEPVVLLVNAVSSNVRVENAPTGRVRVEGYRSGRGDVRLTIGEREGKRIARVDADSATVRIEAPLRAVGVVAESSWVRVDSTGRPVEYLSVKADSSGVRADVALEAGGGVYARIDSSAVRVYAKPAAPGEYWVDVDADSSGLRVEFTGEKTYEVEEETLRATRLVVEGAAAREPTVKVKVRVKADSSSIRLI